MKTKDSTFSCASYKHIFFFSFFKFLLCEMGSRANLNTIMHLKRKRLCFVVLRVTVTVQKGFSLKSVVL